MPEFSPEINQMVQVSWPIVLMVVIFYFLLYRPQQKEQKRRREFLGALKKGERVVTAGGIYGTITGLTDKVVTLKIAERVEIEVSRSAISHSQQDERQKKAP